jgi:predicted transposase YdaD
VIRIWELPAKLFLASPGLTPLAPLADVEEDELPALARQIEQKWSGLPSTQVKDLKSATEVLMGLRFANGLIEGLFGEVDTMEESVIYQKIFRKGEAHGLQKARETLLAIGIKRLGEPSDSQRTAVEKCKSHSRLGRMTVAAVDAPNWTAVLATK